MNSAQGPHSHILMTGLGGGGAGNFFGSEILAKSDFFGFMKDARLFLGYKNKNEGFFGVVKKVLRFFFGGGYVKKVVIFCVDKF